MAAQGQRAHHRPPDATRGRHRPRVSRPETYGIGPGACLYGKTGALDHADVPGRVGDEPLQEVARAVDARGRKAGMQESQREPDLLCGKEMPAADAANRLQCPQRIAEVQHQGPAHHDIESANRLGRNLIDADQPVLDLRSEGLVSNLEAASLLLTGDLPKPLGALAPEARRPVPIGVVGDVRRHNLCRTTALELKRELPVIGAHVETARSADIGPR